jgi:hypothetical protein
LYAALIEALGVITHQEEAAAEQTRDENKSLLTLLPLVQFRIFMFVLGNSSRMLIKALNHEFGTV